MLSNSKAIKKTISVMMVALATTAMITPASAQTRGERAAERAEQAAARRAAAEERLQSMSAERAERAAQRTSFFEHLSTITPDMVEARLDQAEISMLEVLAEADAQLIADTAVKKANAATQILTTQDIERLTDEQIDTLVAAAARAATITPEDVEKLLDVASLQLSAVFDTLDPDAIAATLNEIGERALDLDLEPLTSE